MATLGDMVSIAPGTANASVVQLAAEGDETAFAQIAAAHHPEMVRVGYVVCGDWSLAQDAAQSALWIAWRKLPSLRDPERLRPWLLSVAANEARQLVRRQYRRAIVELKIRPLDAADCDPSTEIDRLDLANALHRLKPKTEPSSPFATSRTSTRPRSVRSSGCRHPASGHACRAW